jgi:hypothetical protein
MEDFTVLPTDDIDSHHDTKLISDEVAGTKSVESDDEVIKPVTQTSSFYTLIASTLAGVAALWLVNKGIIGPEMKTTATESMTLLFSTAIVLGMAWISGKFVESRGKVSVAKLQLAMQREALKKG